MRRFFRGRRLKYGSVSLALTVLVVAAVIITNAALSALSAGFDWYVDMSQSLVYDIGEACEEYLTDTVFPMMDERNRESGKNDKIKIIFCDELKNLDDDISQEYILNTVLELKEKFPERVEIEHLNVWENPKVAKAYGVTDASDVIFAFGDSFTTLTVPQFYVLSGGDTQTPTAYNGEQRIASALLRIVSKDTPICYFTLNHGEGLSDSELMFTLADAGFNYAFIDLAASEIPEDCALLITANPTKDLHEPTETSVISEGAKLDAYMANGGKYMVFFSAETLASGSLPNFEAFLGGWGVKYMTSDTEGKENCYILRDPSSSVSVDGYTFFSEQAENPVANNIFGASEKKNIFGASVALTYAEGFSPDGQGSYTDGDKTWSPLLVTSKSAEAWAGTLLVDKATDDPFTHMSLTTKKCENGETAYLYAVSSVNFCEEDALQSTVYGNHEAIMRMIAHMGYTDAPLSLTSRALTTPPIQSLTRDRATVITVLLCAIPTVLISAVGIFVLVRRKHS